MSALGLLVITVLSGALATVMSVIAWRVARDERRRTDARIAALAAEIHAEPRAAQAVVAAASAAEPEAIRSEPRAQRVPTAPRPRPISIDDLPLRDQSAGSGWAAEPFRGVPAASGVRFGTIAAIGLFACASLTAVVVWLAPGTPTAPAGPAAAPTPASLVTSPLELVALGHDRDGDRLTVRGVVRNPDSAPAPVDGTDAVVHVLDRSGELIASARAPLARAVNPGQDSTFLVAVAGAADVGRYRVSFRAEDRVVPHVDRRDPGIVARAQ